MTRTCRNCRLAIASFFIACFLAAASMPPAVAGQYKNFRVAVYCVVDATQRFADEKVLQTEFDRVMARVKFDKVYLEVYRDRRFADEATLDKIKKFFTDRGVVVEGGLTLSAGGGKGGQFGTFDYETIGNRRGRHFTGAGRADLGTHGAAQRCPDHPPSAPTAARRSAVRRLWVRA